MVQTTPKLLADALLWIQINPHFEVGTEWKFNRERGYAEATHTFYRNHHDKLRVKINSEWSGQFHRLIRSNPRPHDDRMFALTPAGKRFLARFHLWNPREHP